MGSETGRQKLTTPNLGRHLEQWSGAEDHYFGSVMPPDRFDLILGVDDLFVT